MHSKARLNARPQPGFFICDALRCALCVHHVPESIGFGDRADSGAICIRLSGRHHRYSGSKEQHVANLKEVFRRLREANLRLSWERFCQKELIYLGHVMSGEGIRKDARDPEADGPIELQGASAVPADGFVVSALCSQFCVSLAADDCFPEKGGNMTVGRGAINRIGTAE